MIIVFGSIHMNLNMKVRDFPEDGETVLSPTYSMTPGGKGANQALAAARMGAKTALVGKVGDDGHGLRILNSLKRNEVMTSGVAKSEDFPTGMAMVIRGKSGEKRMIVASGANALIHEEQAPAEILHSKNLLLVQMETPIEQNAIVMKRARDNGAPVILNLAPALAIPSAMLSLVDYLIVNQIEARQLAKRHKLDENDAIGLAKAMAKEGNLTCIVTMGPAGVVAVQPNGNGYKIPSMKIEDVIDTTGAGDCFCGTFAACIYAGKPLTLALRTATVASGLSCRHEGTQDAFPYLADIEENLESFPEAKPI